MSGWRLFSFGLSTSSYAKVRLLSQRYQSNQQFFFFFSLSLHLSPPLCVISHVGEALFSSGFVYFNIIKFILFLMHCAGNLLILIIMMIIIFIFFFQIQFHLHVEGLGCSCFSLIYNRKRFFHVFFIGQSKEASQLCWIVCARVRSKRMRTLYGTFRWCVLLAKRAEYSSIFSINVKMHC